MYSWCIDQLTQSNQPHLMRRRAAAIRIGTAMVALARLDAEDNPMLYTLFGGLALIAGVGLLLDMFTVGFFRLDDVTRLFLIMTLFLLAIALAAWKIAEDVVIMADRYKAMERADERTRREAAEAAKTAKREQYKSLSLPGDPFAPPK